MADGHSSHSAAPPAGLHRQGGFQILGRAEAVVDVSVITQLQFPQSVLRQSGGFSCFTETGLTVQTVQKTGFHGAVLGRLSTCTLVGKRQALVQTLQNCGVPQLQCSDKVVDAPAVAVHRRLDVPVIV